MRKCREREGDSILRAENQNKLSAHINYQQNYYWAHVDAGWYYRCLRDITEYKWSLSFLTEKDWQVLGQKNMTGTGFLGFMKSWI